MDESQEDYESSLNDQTGTDMLGIDFAALLAQHPVYPFNASSTSPLGNIDASSSRLRRSRDTWEALRANFRFPESSPIWLANGLPPPVGPDLCFTLCHTKEKLCSQDVARLTDRTSQANPTLMSPMCRTPLPLPFYATIGYSQAGSTFFADAITLHRNIRPACRKEIHFFDHTMYSSSQKYANRKRSYFNIRSYLFCLRGAGMSPLPSNALVGDNTIKSIYVDAWQPVWLKAINPNIKLMVLLRNPVKRSYSRYSMKGGSHICRQYLATDPGVCNNNFDSYVPLMIDFIAKKCPQLVPRGDPSAAYTCASGGAAGREDVDTIVASLYDHHLRHWLNFFSAENFLLIESDKLFKEPLQEINRAINFLGLEGFDAASFRRVEARSKPRTNSHTSKAPKPKAETMELLANFYAPHIEALRDLARTHFGINSLSLEF
ncbi:Heparan sulfate glucosamine 3-O-sulfotransferase 6 [Hondaea fermentalgiana]|uniref:Heparan sulfate glucosamine 3-O-sulfotransferase 6 n=1 Tax=Hondaea fermentalgiana TaxID=2315210 RepID=A0A2R5GWD7_9STRA|nr:Heparan sulfate glucosamine 3-O-sulfotransferase 6 [Hondaea fermentalgiana]|eukprot:GBG32254.1 Heparan sulfate glucosamine 3-O-sulfotransferase 6 [Hondaea fermentalgiana]